VVRANNRQRAAGRWVIAVPVAAAVALAVSGCGQTRLGAVALYGNQRITSAKLTDEVANLNTGYQADKTKVQIQYQPAEMPRQVLTWMLRFATIEKMASRNGITVTPAQGQAQLSAEAARAKQGGDSLQEVAVLNGLPPNMLPELGRWFSIQVQLAKLLDGGSAPKTTAGQTALGARINHQQCLAAKSLHIKVNPQYGAYDYGQFAVIASASTLSDVPTPAPSPTGTAAPQLTPKC
jgi:hypothetical protein